MTLNLSHNLRAVHLIEWEHPLKKGRLKVTEARWDNLANCWRAIEGNFIISPNWVKEIKG